MDGATTLKAVNAVVCPIPPASDRVPPVPESIESDFAPLIVEPKLTFPSLADRSVRIATSPPSETGPEKETLLPATSAVRMSALRVVAAVLLTVRLASPCAPVLA